MNPRIAIAAALALGFALAIASVSTLRTVTSRRKSGNAPHRSLQSQLERLAAVAAEINAYLFVLAIGLGTLDLAVAIALNPPDATELTASTAGQDDAASAAVPQVAAASAPARSAASPDNAR